MELSIRQFPINLNQHPSLDGCRRGGRSNWQRECLSAFQKYSFPANAVTLHQLSWVRTPVKMSKTIFFFLCRSPRSPPLRLGFCFPIGNWWFLPRDMCQKSNRRARWEKMACNFGSVAVCHRVDFLRLVYIFGGDTVKNSLGISLCLGPWAGLGVQQSLPGGANKLSSLPLLCPFQMSGKDNNKNQESLNLRREWRGERRSVLWYIFHKKDLRVRHFLFFLGVRLRGSSKLNPRESLV